MNNRAESYDVIAREVFFPLFAVIAKSAVDLSKINEKHNPSVLDVGCGGGMFGYHIAKIVDVSLTFLDINEDALEICKKRGEEWGLLHKCTYIKSDVKKINIPNEQFDLIVSRGSIGFWGNEQDVTQAFSELYRLLKPGGTIMTGHSLGNAEIESQIREKMKIRNPEWPQSLKNVTSGLNIPDFVNCANKLNINAKELKTDSGHWVFIQK